MSGEPARLTVDYDDDPVGAADALLALLQPREPEPAQDPEEDAA